MKKLALSLIVASSLVGSAAFAGEPAPVETKSERVKVRKVLVRSRGTAAAKTESPTAEASGIGTATTTAPTKARVGTVSTRGK